MNESPFINDLLQQLTVKVEAALSGTGVICKFTENAAHLFIVTAKHNIYGEYFIDETSVEDICLSFLFDTQTIPPQYLTYQLKETDQVLQASNEEDIAVLVVKTEEIEKLTGKLPIIALSCDYVGIKQVLFRGFPNAYRGKKPIRMDGELVEVQKSSPHSLEIKVPDHLADRWLRNEDKTALENVNGFSGSGVFLKANETIFLNGIATYFAPFNRFLATNIKQIEALLIENGFMPPIWAGIELNEVVFNTIKKLKERTKSDVIRPIKNTIGGFCLQRNIPNIVSDNILTVVYGEAGVGKSAFVRDCLETYQAQNECHLLAFKGNQFSKEHLSDVLGESPNAILNSPILRGQKIIWIDGAEKLIENEQFEAFRELIQLVAEIPTIKIILTIRKYSLQHLKLNLLDVLTKTNFVEVPPFTVEEQRSIAIHFPSLQNLLNNPRSSDLLSIPLYLNFAVQLTDSAAYQTTTAAEFRTQLWQRFIRQQNPKREQILERIALERAKSFSIYVNLETENDEITKKLEAEGIIEREADELGNRFAIVHDIIEDWTLTRYIQRHWRDNPEQLFENIGAHYAIRRAFRLWLSERLVEVEDDFSSFVQNSLTDNAVISYWKDAIMLALLQSKYITHFLNTQKEFLLANNAKILNRFIHIFKMACKEPDVNNLETDYWKIYSHNFKPTGEGWVTLIGFFYQNIESLSEHELILRFIQDWQNKLVAFEPVPPESREVGLILIHILEQSIKGENPAYIVNHRFGQQIEKAIKTLFRLAEVMPVEIESLINQALQFDRKATDANWQLSEFHDFVIEPTLSCFASREVCCFLPDLVIKAAWHKWMRKPKPNDYYDSMDKKSSWFGVIDDHSLHYFPSNHYKTPVYFLLYFHPVKGLKFIVELFNRVTPQYVETLKQENAYRNRSYGYYEEPSELSIVLENGITVQQMSCDDFYRMYRGTSNTAYLLESVLMALEKWLFVMAESKDSEQQGNLHFAYDYLLSNSKSVATTAVLIGVASAYPSVVGDKIFPLLRLKEFYDLERSRSTHEMHSSSIWGHYDEYPKQFQKERYESNQLPHRKTNLDALVLQLSQISEYQEQVFEILDELYQNADPNHKNWRIRISGMDIRKFQVSRITDDGQHAIIEPKLEEDLVQHIEQSKQNWTPQYDTEPHSTWAFNVFKKEETEPVTLKRWVDAYDVCSEAYANGYSGVWVTNCPAAIAAVGLRELFGQLSTSQIDWCCQIIINVAEKVIAAEKNYGSSLADDGIHLFDRDPSVHALPLLLKENMSSKNRQKVVELLFKTLIDFRTGDNLKIPFWANIRQNLWKIDPSVSKSLWHGLIAYSRFRSQNALKFRLANDRPDSKDTKILQNELSKLTQQVVLQTVEKPLFEAITFETHDHNWLDTAMTILPDGLADDEFTRFTSRYMHLLVQKTYEDRNYGERNDWINYMHAGNNFKMRFPNFLFGQPLKIRQLLFSELLNHAFDLKERRSHNTYEFLDDCLEWLVLLSDNANNARVFAELWEQLFETMTTKKYLFGISRLFLNIKWNEPKTEDVIFKPIDYQKDFFKKAIAELGYADTKSVVRLLAGVGGRVLLPEGISLLASIGRSNPITDWEIIEAERLIQRVYYNQLKAIRQRPKLLEDFIQILDWLIDADSSLAFYIRERVVGTVI